MASTSFNPCQCKYDVFISFRGADVRDGFLSHLFEALCKKQIIAFKDENLERGEKIDPALLQRIKESHISIVIFSENYAYSSWCLDELVKIIHCKEEMGRTILPVFYRIDPTDVQELKGTYGDALVEHEKEFQDKVPSWKRALVEAAAIAGFPSQDLKSESILVNEIVNNILERLNKQFTSDSCDDLIGIESRLKDVERLLDLEAVDVRFLGIWGMAGIGKTTLASKVFDRFSSQFQGHCFIANVREELEHCSRGVLQEKIQSMLLANEHNVGMSITSSSSIRGWIMRKKVLIVLDDVWDLDVVQFLVGKQNIYAPGSRIIITSRDKQILKNIGAEMYQVQEQIPRSIDVEIYQLKELNYAESLQLFSLHAFKQNYRAEAFMEASGKAVVYAGGNPLALRVLGSNLFGKNEVELWEDQLKKLENIPDKKIENILRISYDELDKNEKEIFLDIACFFCLEDKEHVQNLLESCLGRFAIIGINHLHDKCLLSISDNRLIMHDLLQQMGKNIVHMESDKNPGKRSRLWNPQDIYRVLSKDMGTGFVESMCLDLTRIRSLKLSPTAFFNMSNLRFLKFYYDPSYHSFYHEHFSYKPVRIQGKIHLSQEGLNYLPDELRYLYWFGYPLKSLPSSFCPEKLVQLHLIHSHVEQLCNKDQCLENLEVLDLSYSINLRIVPDLSQLPKLEVLHLRGCVSLVEIHSSVPRHNKLSILDLRNCKTLCSLPKFFEFKNLDCLLLKGCSKLTEFPKVPRDLKRLNLSATAIREVPHSMGHHSCLTELRFRSCRRLEGLPSSIGELKCLEVLDLEGCSKIKELPEVPCNIKELFLNETIIQKVPSSIGHCSLLIGLYLRSCTRLESLPSSIGELKCLERLHLEGCSKLRELPEVPCNIKELVLEGATIQEVPSSIGLCSSLIDLKLRSCTRLQSLPSSIGELKCLEIFYLDGCSKLKSLPDELCNLKALKYFKIERCQNLNGLPENLGNLESLQHFYAAGSGLKRLPPSINSLERLYHLDCTGCIGLTLPPLTGLVHLQYLLLEDCGMTEISIHTGSLGALAVLDLSGNFFKELPMSICSLVQLGVLDLGGNPLETLPTSIEKLSGLGSLRLSDCKRLECLPELPSSLQYFELGNCTSLRSMLAERRTKGKKCSRINAPNCMNLDVNIFKNITDEMLARIECLTRQLNYVEFAEGQPFREGLCIPCEEVPQWIEYQNNDGSFLQCQPIPDPINFMMLTFCVVLAPNQDGCIASNDDGCIASNDDGCIASNDDGCRVNKKLQCESNLESDCGQFVHCHSWCSIYNWETNLAAEHVFLWYSVISSCSNYIWKKASFKFDVGSERHLVIKCGVHLSYHDEGISYHDSAISHSLNYGRQIPEISTLGNDELSYGSTEEEARAKCFYHQLDCTDSDTDL